MINQIINCKLILNKTQKSFSLHRENIAEESIPLALPSVRICLKYFTA